MRHDLYCDDSLERVLYRLLGCAAQQAAAILKLEQKLTGRRHKLVCRVLFERRLGLGDQLGQCKPNYQEFCELK
jgi:hypothetical protein